MKPEIACSLLPAQNFHLENDITHSHHCSQEFAFSA
jgi:hypothetical protein